MNSNRRTLLAAASIGLTAGLESAHAQTYPTRPITLIVPFAPGGNVDTTARALSVPLGKVLGQPIIVDNRSGGGGAVGSSLAARAAPDGYTLLVGNPGQVSTLPLMFKTGYDKASFQTVGLISKTSIVFIVRGNDMRFKSIADLVAYAKAKPGEINVGHPGPGTPNHLALLEFEDSAQVKLKPVAYRGGAPAIADLLGGTLDAGIDQITGAMPHIKAGALRALAVLGPTPEPNLSTVPTLKQAGIPEIDGTTYVGMLVCAGTSPEVDAKLRAGLATALQDPQMTATLKELGSYVYPGNAQEFQKIIAAEEKVAAAYLKEGKLKTE